jgi:putative ABC transport system ATP-binding protein
VLGILEALHGEGMTLFMVTHDPQIGRRARRRIRMLDGRIVADQHERHG